MNQNYLKTGSYSQKGKDVTLNNFIGAYSIAEVIKTTLGPKGMDKILQPMGAGPKSRDIVITNDGATIL